MMAAIHARRPISAWLAVAAALVCHTLLGVPPALADEASELYEDAVTRFERGEYRATHIQLKNALQADPNNLSARLLMGRLALVLGDGASAEKEFRLAQRFGADDEAVLEYLAEAMLLQSSFDELFETMPVGGHSPQIEAIIRVAHGQARLEQRRLDEAEALFAEAAELAPKAPEPRLGQAVVALLQGELTQAEVIAEQASAIAPHHAESWHIRGDIRRLEGDTQGALANYTRAISLDPHLLSTRLVRATLLLKRNQDEAALEDIRYVLAARTWDPHANYLYAVGLARANRLEEAQAAMRRASQSLDKLGPVYVDNHLPTLLLSGRIRFQQGDLGGAYKDLDRYVSLVPYHAGARKMLGAILLRTGNVFKAIRILEPAVAMRPDDPQLLALLGSAYLKDRRFSKAERLLEKAAALAPTEGDIRTQLALTRLAGGRQADAIAELKAAMTLTPGATKPGLVVGFLHLQHGDHQAALRVARELIRRAPDSPVGYNLAGAAHVQGSDLEAARASFEQALKVDPANTSARYSLAKVDLATGDRVAAAARYRTIVDLDPRASDAMVQLSRIAEQEGRIEDAIRWLEKLRATDPTVLAAQRHLAVLYVRSGEPGQALSVAKELSERFPEDFSARMTLGRIQLAVGDATNAARTFRRMARLPSLGPRELEIVARGQTAANDREGARVSLLKAIQGDPDYLPAQASLVLLDSYLGKFDEALSRATTLRDKHPDLAIGYALSGDVMMRANKFAQAAEYFAAAQAREPRSETATRLYRARRAAAAGAPRAHKTALEELQRWVSNHPGDSEAGRQLAAGYMEIGRFEAAGKLHEELLTKFPDDAALLNNLALVYLEAGDPRALPYAQRAHELAPDQPATLDTYGWVLVQHGQVDRALQYLREAHDRAAENPEIRYHLGVALSRLGRTDEARRHLQRALGSGGTFSGAEEARALLRKLSGKS